MAELQDEIIKYRKEVEDRETQYAKNQRETFWFHVIFWGLLATMPIGLIIGFAGAPVTGMVFFGIGLVAALIFVIGALSMV